jgi:iron(III) transport system substrate-binding protein
VTPALIEAAKNWIEPYVTEDMAKHFPHEQRDPNGMHATLCAWLEVIGYNTNLVKPEDAPRSYADLLNPKWQGSSKAILATAARS